MEGQVAHCRAHGNSTAAAKEQTILEMPTAAVTQASPRLAWWHNSVFVGLHDASTCNANAEDISEHVTQGYAMYMSSSNCSCTAMMTRSIATPSLLLQAYSMKEVTV